MYSFKLDKLVRDKPIERMEASGVNVKYRVLEDDEYVLRLKKKVVEEALEVLDAKNSKEIREELCDLTEVIDSLIVALGLSYDDIKNTRAEKAERAGGLKRRSTLNLSAMLMRRKLSTISQILINTCVYLTTIELPGSVEAGSARASMRRDCRDELFL